MTFRRLVIALLVSLVLVSVVVVFFNRLVRTDLILARGDVFLYFYPYWQYAAAAIREGHVPLWNPYLFMGAPFLANSQVGLFYLFNWPLWLLFDTPYAVSFSIILHLVIASFGAYLMARRCFSLSRMAAVLAAMLFSLGGYLTAQVEHINQIQGLAWLPWYFVVLCPWPANIGSPRHAVRVSACIAAILSLQLLSGHTQTAFISLAAIFIWLIVTWFGNLAAGSYVPQGKSLVAGRLEQAWSFASPIVLGLILALCIAAVQILPTIELSSQSLRRGGLPPNEVLSFSLQPLQMGQSLLPAYDSLVFSEYALFVPITALLLAIVGTRKLWRNRETRPFLVLAVAGFILAFGRFNPIYHLLAIIPGFSYFRAPARWSVLFALVIAMAAGTGWQALSSMGRKWQQERGNSKEFRSLAVGVVIIVSLVAWSIVSAYLAPSLPIAAELTVEPPTLITLAAWIGELAVACMLIFLLVRGRARTQMTGAIFFLTIVILFISTRTQPYNHPTTARAYFEQRAPISRMLTSAACDPEDGGCVAPKGRILGLSDIFFDLGDQAELDTIYREVLGESERFDFIVASKQKEVLGPNLPLAYGLESVDGFDGGVLPLARYASLMRLILPDDELTLDGRLREHLASVPDERWLDLLGAKYLITDKVGDEWRQEVFFDMKLPTTVSQNTGAVGIGYLPDYEASGLRLISDGQPGTITLEGKEGGQWSLEPDRIDADLWQVRFPEPTQPNKITLDPCDPQVNDQPCDQEWHVRSLALIDERDGSFMPLSIGDYRLIYSGDVKIYENLDVLPRAVLLYDWRFVDNLEQSLAVMRAAEFDPSRSVVVSGTGPATGEMGNGQVVLTSYQPEHISFRTESDSLALLLITDAFYPGWRATIDGVPTQIVESDIMFRGIFVPPGLHDIELRYLPVSYTRGRVISAIGLLIWISMVIYGFVLPIIEDLRKVNRTGEVTES